MSKLLPQSPKEVAGSIDLHDVVLVPIKSLKKDPSNPNIFTERQLNGLRASMKRFGYLQPIIVDRGTMIIADGEHRMQIYQESGRDEVPCILLDLKDDAERRLLRQTMNKLRGMHDAEKDMKELDFLVRASRLNELSLLTGTESVHILSIIKGQKQVAPIEKPIRKVESRCKKGQIWKLGDHRLMCGDAKKRADVSKLIGNRTIDLMLTDPPYGISIVHDVTVGFGAPVAFKTDSLEGITRPRHYVSARPYQKGMTGDTEEFDPRKILEYGKIKIIFGANHFANFLPNGNHWIVWDKKAEIGSDDNNFTDVELAWTNVDRKGSKIYRQAWSGLLRQGNRQIELADRIHPTQKPVNLLAQIISDYSKQNDVILDLFAGSGSTLIACEMTDRNSLLMEIEPYYCDAILERWEKFTEKKAILVK